MSSKSRESRRQEPTDSLFEKFRKEATRVKKRFREFRKRLGLTKKHRSVNPIRDAVQSSAVKTKELFLQKARAELKAFLASGKKIVFPETTEPEVSIIIITYNRAELNLVCFKSILENPFHNYEVLIVDNGSNDLTPQLLDRLENAKVIRNRENLNYLLATNQVASHARGKYLLLLNHDTKIVGDSIARSLQTIRSSPDIGAVGGKIIYFDGKLQEAGSVIWQSGFCQGYGRGKDPFACEYNFQRDVDFCSAAFLLTPREAFIRLGMFDKDYEPLYYEDVDYCVRLLKSGKRIVYDPNVMILHYEFSGSSSEQAVRERHVKHREIFVSKHQEWLQSQLPGAKENMLKARQRSGNAARILFIDDRVPYSHLGQGYPRSKLLLAELVQAGNVVTFYPLTKSHDDWSLVANAVPASVELMLDYGTELLHDFLTRRRDYYDLIVVSRPPNMDFVNSLLDKEPGLSGAARIIYDAEALFALREIQKGKITAQEIPDQEQQELIRHELGLVRHAQGIISVSEPEANHFRGTFKGKVHVLSHAIDAPPTPAPFEERNGILFIGAMPTIKSPNADSILWFLEEVLPLIHQKLKVKFKAIGSNKIEEILKHASEDIQFESHVKDLFPAYDHHRIFIAPTRFAAGIPLKIIETAAHGVPVVTTSLIASQLGWQNEKQLLVADTPESFAQACLRLYEDKNLWHRLRQNALLEVQQEFSTQRFRSKVREILNETLICR